MSHTESTKPRIVEVADEILADIKARRLAVGDAYLKTQEAAKRFKVGTQTANRALQLLVQQGVLKRANKSGCVIAGEAAEPVPLARVHIVVHREHMKMEGLMEDGMVLGLQRELAGAQVLFHFLPQYGEDDFVRGVIAEAMRGSGKSGFILARSSYELQKLVARSGVPAVVFGTPYRAVAGLASLDRDHDAAGRLLAQKLLERGCRRMIVLMRNNEWPGDFAFLDAIQSELAAADIPADRVRVRHLPADSDAIVAEMAYLLAESEGMAGVIARSEPLALGALRAAKAPGVTRGVVVASDVYRRAGAERPGFLHVQALWSAEQVGARLGRMLRLQAAGERAESGWVPVGWGAGIRKLES